MADIDAVLDQRPTASGRTETADRAVRTVLRAFAAPPAPARRVPPAGDRGQPIADLPPIVEPVAFVAPMPPAPGTGQRPPRRAFLAPVAPPNPVADSPPPRLFEPVRDIAPARRATPQPAAQPHRAPSRPAPPPLPPPPLPAPAVPLARPAPAAQRRPAATMPAAVERRPPAAVPAGIAAPAPAPSPWDAGRWLARVATVAEAARRQPRAIAAGLVITIGIVATLYLQAGTGVAPSRQPVTAVAPPPSDPAQRAAYYRDAASGGDTDAALQLAILYAKGEGVPQDYAKAATWFQAAADRGVARAQYDLGVLYERGRGMPADFAAAAGWYRKAAEQHFPLAEYNLAVAYTKGQGIRQDMVEAAQWYRRAAGQGVVQAMINLAVLYERGEGVAASPADAYAWYLAAGQRGNQPSARRSDELFAVLTRVDQVRAQALATQVAGSIHDPAPSLGSGADAETETPPKTGADAAAPNPGTSRPAGS